jgi:anti-sigma factor RsiW
VVAGTEPSCGKRPGKIPWPSGGARLGSVEVRETSMRGCNVVLWRAGDLGHAVVSDVNAKELNEVASRLASGVARGGS